MDWVAERMELSVYTFPIRILEQRILKYRENRDRGMLIRLRRVDAYDGLYRSYSLKSVS